MGEELKKFSGTPSGRSSIFEGAAFTRGITIVPQQILELFHDTRPAYPIPKDARFTGISMKSEGVDSEIGFHFVSEIAPEIHCFSLKPGQFMGLLIDLASGLIPADAQIDGFELSKRWTYLLVRATSSHWPAALDDDLLPMVHIRYDFKQLIVDATNSTLLKEIPRIKVQ